MSEIATQEPERIKTILVPKIIKCLGKENEKVSCKVSIPENCFFISNVYFVELNFSNYEDKNEEQCNDTLKLVIKKQPLNAAIDALFRMTEQFHNEILFYTKFARGNERFPRCIYTAQDNVKNTAIVMENIDARGYKICPEAYDVPYEYVLETVNEIGRFHAIGYIMKERETEKFNEIISEIQDPRFQEDGLMSKFVNLSATRPIEWLRRNNCEKKFCDGMERYLENGFQETVLASVKPVEPLATLCHGDLTRNNIFFRKIDGKLAAMIFDFALIFYSSPAIDIATFLYLNCSAEDRIMRFDELYRSYHNTLISYLRDAGIDNLEKYSYDNMLADYKRRAVFGYAIALFFLPIIRNVTTVDFDDLINEPVICALKNRESGGEAMTEIFGKMILELRDSGCLDHVP